MHDPRLTSHQTSKNGPSGQSEKDKKAERLARVQAWKQSQQHDGQQRKEPDPATDTRSLLAEIDKKATKAPEALAKPQGVPKVAVIDKSVPFARKFGIPSSGSGKSMPSVSTNGTHANANGLTTNGAVPSKRRFQFEEDEGSKKKLTQLDLPALEDDTQEPTVEVDEDTEVIAAVDTMTDADGTAKVNGDAGESETALTSAPADASEDASVDQARDVDGDAAMEDAEEELDPLDAFMTEMVTEPKPSTIKSRPAKEPEVLLGDDDVEMTAVTDSREFLAIPSKKNKKDIPSNPTDIQYEPFEKDFYTEPAELHEMGPEEVDELRASLDGIKVKGSRIPKPVLRWGQFGLNMKTKDVIDAMDYGQPSAIQAQAIPCIMSGRDVIGIAKTGSGKTIAFLLPMFRHIKAQRKLGKMEGPIGIIFTPTRELASQIYQDCKPFLKALELRAVCASGGAQIKDQIAQLKSGAEIVICTPGRMIDLLRANSGRVVNLRRVTFVAIDESDRMFDMGFKPQVTKILENIRRDRQTVLFSATFTSEMEDVARRALRDPIEIVVGGRSIVGPEITQQVEVRTKETKFTRLLEVLGKFYEEDEDQEKRALIFVNNQETADNLQIELNKKQYVCISIHGGRDQIDRDSAISDFKSGNLSILIATSVAARGLDVKQLRLVINYDAPNHLEDYVHRVGRTGRAGNTGTAITFVTEDQDAFAVGIAKALEHSSQAVPQELQDLVDKHLENVKAGKAKTSGSGFGGKGLEKLDQERAATRQRERKAYKTGDEKDEANEEEEKGEKDEDTLISKAASQVQAASTPTPLAGVPKGIDLDGKITVHKTESTLEKVNQAVAGIKNRLNNPGSLRQGVPIDNKGPDAGAYHATLEINDFPQKARWAVTNRTNVAKILESTGTSITTKGSYYLSGKEPGPNDDPKLYILVEGDTDVVVTNAMRELMRLLKEGTIAAADSEAKAPTGRYNVV